ncbi:hypothetical protein VYU27_004144 [Nannochloropsis oceanica]
MLEDGIGLLQRQREWADSRERRLEAARVVKAVEEVAEVRSMPDLSEARSSWLKAKAEHKRAQLRALEQDKERQAVEVLKQQVVLKRHQGMHRQGGTRRLKQQEEVLQLPSAQPSEKGHNQLERRNLSHVPLRLVCSTSIVDTVLLVLVTFIITTPLWSSYFLPTLLASPFKIHQNEGSSWENADAPWGRDLPSLDLLDDHGKLYTDGSHEVASLLHDHGAWAGDSDEQENDSGDVELRRWSSCDSPSSPSSSSSSRSKSRSRSRSSGSSSSSISIGADLARSWKVKLVQEEDVLLARMLNSGVDKVGESKWEERERQH